MNASDAIAVIILFVFLGWLVAILVGLKIVNNYVRTNEYPPISLEQQANVLRDIGPKNV